MSEAIIVVTGAVVARPDTLQALLTASLEHVNRSRSERGCLSHAVSIDAENALRLTFLEHWEDLPSLALHLRQPRSMAFLTAIRSLAEKSEGMQVYVARATDLAAISAAGSADIK